MSNRQEILDKRKEDIMGPKKAPKRKVNAQMLTFLARSEVLSLIISKQGEVSYHGKKRDRARLRDR